MVADDVLSALADIKEGRVQLTAAEHTAFLDAVEGLARVLIRAPRGADSVQIAIWHKHERTPALAQLADAARPGKSPWADELEAARIDELRIVPPLRGDLAPA